MKPKKELMNIRLYLKDGTTIVRQYESLDAFDKDSDYCREIGVAYHQTMMTDNDAMINTFQNGRWVDISEELKHVELNCLCVSDKINECHAANEEPFQGWIEELDFQMKKYRNLKGVELNIDELRKEYNQ